MKHSAAAFPVVAFAFVLTQAAAPVIAGQRTEAISAQRPSILEIAPYDAARRGPLIYVPDLSPGNLRISPRTIDSLEKFAAIVGRNVVPAGSVTVLAPRTMVVFEENLGRPDPYAGLSADERFRVLASLFTTDQWKQAGSERGIGAGDMDDRQRGLFLGLLPAKLVAQRTMQQATAEPLARRNENIGDATEFAPQDARLRLVRKVEFQFSKQGADDYSHMSSVEPGPGEERYVLSFGGGARGDAQPDANAVTVFGVPVLRTVASYLKSSQIDFSAEVLQRTISFDEAPKTVGDLIASIARVAGIDVVADRRIASARLFYRSAPGQRARAGDLLKGLCWSVTGTIRRVGRSTYLLTDDIKGIGARFARIAEWAEEAHSIRYKALEDLDNAAAKHDPLSYIGFAPGDANALSAEQLRRVDDAYRNRRNSSSPEMMPSELSNSLQRSFQEILAFWTNDGVSLRTDRIRVGTSMSVQIAFPGGVAVQAPWSDNIHPQFLQHIAFVSKLEPSAQPARAAGPAKPMLKSVKKRVVRAVLPANDEQLARLVMIAKAKGFTDLWLHVTLGDTGVESRLTWAVDIGKRNGLNVGAEVSVLRKSGLDGAEDINILGETGTQFAKRRSSVAPDQKSDFARIAGWSSLAPDPAIRHLLQFVRVPGLSALILTATAAPGWAGAVEGGDGIPTNGYLGYDIATRIACIRAEGYDPIDVSNYIYSARLEPSLPFFPSPSMNGPWKTVCDFRLKRNKSDMATIHAALRNVRPNLPLYLDDRASPYTRFSARWFARWDIAANIPVNPVFAEESEAREVARTASPEALLCIRGVYGDPDTVARAFGLASQKAVNWQGVTFDLAAFSSADTLKVVAALPDDAHTTRSR